MKTAWALLCVPLCVLVTVRASVLGEGEVQGRIAGGVNASADQFPWQASIIMDRTHFCSGSLVAPNWVLTSAHCTYKYSAFIVHLGTIYPNSHLGEETLSHEKYVHPDFDADDASFDNDVGLIKLVRNINFTETVSAVAIEGSTASFVGYKGRVAGWGNSSSKLMGNLAPSLHWTEITILDDQECSEQLGLTIDVDHLCSAGSENSGVCGGDDGGALVLKFGDQWTLLGIAASNISGCDSGKPSVYTKISRHAEWITSVTGIKIYASSAPPIQTTGSLLMLAATFMLGWMSRKML